MSNPAIKQPPSSILERLIDQRIVAIRRLGQHGNGMEIVLQDGTLIQSTGELLVQPKRGKAEVL